MMDEYSSFLASSHIFNRRAVLRQVTHQGDVNAYTWLTTPCNQVKENPFLLILSPKQFRYDREIVLAALSRTGSALEYASDELTADREVVLAAVLNDGLSLEYASETLQVLFTMMHLKLTPHGPINFRWLDQDDLDVCMSAVLQNGRALEFVSDRLSGDKSLVSLLCFGRCLNLRSRDLTHPLLSSCITG
jgi:hypothetical protein